MQNLHIYLSRTFPVTFLTILNYFLIWPWTWCCDLVLSRSRVCSNKLLPQGIIHTKWHLHMSNTWAMVSDLGRRKKTKNKNRKNNMLQNYFFCNIISHSQFLGLNFILIWSLNVTPIRVCDCVSSRSGWDLQFVIWGSTWDAHPCALGSSWLGRSTPIFTQFWPLDLEAQALGFLQWDPLVNVIWITVFSKTTFNCGRCPFLWPKVLLSNNQLS